MFLENIVTFPMRVILNIQTVRNNNNTSFNSWKSVYYSEYMAETETVVMKHKIGDIGTS